MKLLVKILLIISLGLNVYFVWDTKRIRNNRIWGESFMKAFGSGEINKTTWTKGFESFITKLKQKDQKLANKKYFYINTWATFCSPCIKEMPFLDSLAGTLRNDVAYVFVSEISDESATSCIKRHKYNIKNFIFLNDMGDFISGICNEKGTKTKPRSSDFGDKPNKLGV